MHTVHRQVTKHRLGLCHGYSLWVADGVNHIDFLDAGTTMNSESYIATLKTLKRRPEEFGCTRTFCWSMTTLSLTPRHQSEATEKLDWISPLTTTAMQSRLGVTRLHLFQKWTKTFMDICVTRVKRWNALSRAWRRNAVWNCFVTSLRNLSVIGGSVRSMVVSRGAVNTDDKRAHIKNWFRVSFIEGSLLKQK